LKNLEAELRMLDRADRDVEAARERVARQRAIVKRLEELKADVSLPLELLQTLQDTVTALEGHRSLIMARIVQLRSGDF
jgi:hypothetical protein